MSKKKTKSKPEKKITITMQEGYNTQLDHRGQIYMQKNNGPNQIAGSFNMGTDEWELFCNAMLTVDHPQVTVKVKSVQTSILPKETVEI